MMAWDWNTVDAFGSLLSGIASLVSLVGILFAVVEVRRARKIVDRETDYRIYEMMLDLDRFFIDNADLRPYVYGGATLPESIDEHSPEYHRIMAVVEMVIDFMECAYSQFDLMPIFQRVGWIDYMIDIGQNSPLIRDYVDSEREWYLGSFVNLILTGEFDPRLDKWDAKAEWRHINKAHWRNRMAERLRRDRPSR